MIQQPATNLLRGMAYRFPSLPYALHPSVLPHYPCRTLGGRCLPRSIDKGHDFGGVEGGRDWLVRASEKSKSLGQIGDLESKICR